MGAIVCQGESHSRAKIDCHITRTESGWRCEFADSTFVVVKHLGDLEEMLDYAEAKRIARPAERVSSP